MTGVALVLGAGGTVGHAYNVGVVGALADEFGWDARDADLIVGTSAGSVVGATLRIGLSAHDMRRRTLGEAVSPAGAELVRRAGDAVADARRGAPDDGEPEGNATIASRLRIASPERVRRAIREPWKVTPGSLFSALVPPGRMSTDHLGAAYDELLGDRWPAAPLWVNAVDLDAGHRVVFGRSGPPVSLGLAVRASCAIPGYFAPVQIGDSRYVDGGVQSTTNADVVVDFDPLPELTIVVAPMSAVGQATATPRFSIRQLARRSVAREARLLRARGVEVVTFQPTVADLELLAGSSMDPRKAAAVCRRAVESTLEHVREPEIADRLVALHR